MVEAASRRPLDRGRRGFRAALLATLTSLVAAASGLVAGSCATPGASAEATAERAPASTGHRPAQPPSRDAFAAGRHRGICFAHSMRHGGGYGSPDSAAALGEVRGLGATWVSVTPFAFLAGPRETSFRRLGGESDDRVAAVVAQAHAQGLKVLLKPHVWLRSPSWPGEIVQDDEAGWARLFAAYEELVVHYARLARSSGADALLIGNEMERTTVREREWRHLIAVARREYGGPLTYGANFAEVEKVPFWDALDFIGVSGYFPLVDGPSPSRREIVRGWQPVIARLAELSRRTGRQVVFTEVGYPATEWAVARPWEESPGAAPDPQLQADAFAAFYDAVWTQPWVGGAYWWKWFSSAAPERDPFGFAGMPAAEVVRRQWGSGAPALPGSR